MSWDRKRRGPSGGYFYRSVRVPDRPHPVKVYLGRGARAAEAAAEVDRAREDRRAAAREAERDGEAERLADELGGWAELLSSVWLVLSGHHKHRGCWRRSHG